MNEEIKNGEKQECKCCECREKLVKALKEFTFKALIVYVGVTLAIITSANILKPKHHCHKMPPRPGIERQMPPMVQHGDFHRNMKKHKHFKNVKRPGFDQKIPADPQQLPVKPNK